MIAKPVQAQPALEHRRSTTRAMRSSWYAPALARRSRRPRASAPSNPSRAERVKITAGVGFKPEYFEEALSSPADGLWFEVHAENYMVAGGPRLAMLQALRERRPLSLHGVGLSLASPEEPDAEARGRLRDLSLRFEPALVSEHLAWSRLGPISYPDLLPFPRSHAMLAALCRNVQIAQETVG